jgi:hypothetical protein
VAGLLTDEEMIDRVYGPSADTPTSEIYRLLGLNPNLKRGTILPLARNEQGALEVAVPQSLIDLARAFRLPARAMGGGSYGPEDIANFALNTGALGAVGTKPAGALASGAARGSKPSALPMDEASRMARAREMGAAAPEDVWYHGSPNDLYAGSREMRTSREPPQFFAAKSPFTAAEYSRGRMDILAEPDANGKIPLEKSGYAGDGLQGGVYQMRSLAQNPLEFDAKGQSWIHIPMDVIAAEAKAKGHDAVIYRNIIDGYYSRLHPTDVIAWLDKTKIRSSEAAFDPAKKGSADLLAGVVGLPGGSFLTGLNQDRSKRGISKIAK